MGEPFILIALLFGFLGLAAFIAGIVVVKKRRVWGMAASFAAALVLLCLGGMLATISIATQGYRALTREDTAAVVKIEPAGPGRFNARFQFPDGRAAVFNLAGDELYVDAHILKWKPIANYFGLHTSYELDRVAGRHLKIEDEQAKPRTVFSLSREKPVDLFSLRRRYALLSPLLDAEYGSGTFIEVQKAAELEIRVSTTGLLIRKKESGGGETRSKQDEKQSK
jgi:hypothetical protein